ncbi:MAG: DUF4058 family protein [Planctomycetes bacterium]|nr:DUF4058 family protein [Planctomycetota bacterium]
MLSPFPGMDPYLERSSLWEGFHANLAVRIQDQLVPRLRPRYYAAVTPRVTYDEVVIEEKRAPKPDVSVYEIGGSAPSTSGVAILPAPMTGLVTLEMPVKEYAVEIHDTEEGSLVTAIEILSPVNKRRGHDAYKKYRRKRRDLLRSMAHLMEIDLLRTGERSPLLTPLPDAPYFVFLSRENKRPKVEIWPLGFREPIPVLPVPLRDPDPDVPLDLGLAIQTGYDRAGYDLRIDYSRPPPGPDLKPEDAAWIRELIERGQGGAGGSR